MPRDKKGKRAEEPKQDVDVAENAEEERPEGTDEP
jgi:hypothetical protein